ncbi:MAG: SLC45 family MFS transporter [Candidatus Lokiarchaeota archaeon]|nr:SLC45 family MFS transporter [Candidatus Lokiarchaeota archaeon]
MMAEQQQRKVKLDYRMTFLIGFAFLSTGIWQLYNVKMPIMLTFFLGTMPWKDFIIGIIMVLDNITAVFLQPYFGALSDRTRTKFGKRVPYLMIGIPFAAISFVLIPQSMNLWMLLALIMCFNFAMALYRSPAVALMPDLTPSEVRAKGNAIINLMGGLGTIAAYLVGMLTFDKDPSGATAFGIGGIIMIVCLVVVVTTVDEQKVTARMVGLYGPDFAADKTELKKFRVQAGAPGAEKKRNLAQRLASSDIVMLFREKEKSAIFMLLAIFCLFMAFNAIETFFSLYAVNVLGFSEGQASNLMLFLPLMFIAFALPAGIMSEKVGRRKIIKIGLLLMACLIATMIFTTSFPLVMIVVLGIGMAYSLVNINTITVVWQLAPDGKIGAYTGVYYLFSALAQIISPVLVGFFFSVSEGTLGPLRYALLFPYGVVFLIVAFLMMFKVKRGEVILSKEEIEKLKKVYEKADD